MAEEPASFMMRAREYAVWRLGTETQAAQVEQTIRERLVAQGEQGPVSLITPHGDIAFSFLIRDQDTALQRAEQPCALGRGQERGESSADRLAVLHERMEALEHERSTRKQTQSREHGMGLA